MPNFMLIVLFATLAAAQDNVTTLERAHPIERELIGGDAHSYAIVLSARDFLRLVFDQRGIDVVVTAYGPDQKKFAEVDSPNGDHGPEPVEFVAPVVGTYRFDVRSLEKTAKPGRYEARIEQWMTGDEYAAHLAAIKAAEVAASNAIRGMAVSLRTVEPRKGFADLEPLGALVGDAHLVALGEATHGTREFFQLKHRILEFLVEQKGFTVFAIEATMPESFDINEYVLTGKGNARKALAGLYFWTWNTEEVLDMIEWMRRYNANPLHTKKVKFYGFDMQSAQRALKVARKYLQTVDPAGWPASDALDLLTNALTDSDFDALPGPKKQEALMEARTLLTRMDARQKDYEKKSGAEAWTIARQHADVLAQNIERRSSKDWQARDRFMAQNVQWIRNHEGPDTKMVLWAHNGHVSTAPDGWMGSFLRKTFNKDMVVFGFAFDEGSFQAFDVAGAPGIGVHPFSVSPAPAGSLDAIVAAAAVPIAIIDLRDLPDDNPLAKWLGEPRLTRNVGSMYNAAASDRFFGKQKIREEYDALVFVEKTTAARSNPGAHLYQFERLPKPGNLVALRRRERSISQR